MLPAPVKPISFSWMQNTILPPPAIVKKGNARPIRPGLISYLINNLPAITPC